jgi:hypothetical protein
VGVIYPTVNYTVVGTTFAQQAEAAGNHDNQVEFFVFVNALKPFVLLSHEQSSVCFESQDEHERHRHNVS